MRTIEQKVEQTSKILGEEVAHIGNFYLFMQRAKSMDNYNRYHFVVVDFQHIGSWTYHFYEVQYGLYSAMLNNAKKLFSHKVKCRVADYALEHKYLLV